MTPSANRICPGDGGRVARRIGFSSDAIRRTETASCTSSINSARPNVDESPWSGPTNYACPQLTELNQDFDTRLADWAILAGLENTIGPTFIGHHAYSAHAALR